PHRTPAIRRQGRRLRQLRPQPRAQPLLRRRDLRALSAAGIPGTRLRPPAVHRRAPRPGAERAEIADRVGAVGKRNRGGILPRARRQGCRALVGKVRHPRARQSRLRLEQLSRTTEDRRRTTDGAFLYLIRRPSSVVVPQTTGSGNPAPIQAARSVLASRHAIVIGPTPPGTGVIAPATSTASAKLTSPTMRDLPPSTVSRLIPTSMTVEPGLIQPPRTNSGRPMAANKRSARPHRPARSRVRECAMVTVAFSASRSCTSGLPTMLERPITTASSPLSDACTALASLMQPTGVHGANAGNPDASRPALSG